VVHHSKLEHDDSIEFHRSPYTKLQVLVYLGCFARAAGMRFPGPQVQFVDILEQHSEQDPE
jgi:hypothetical protein